MRCESSGAAMDEGLQVSVNKQVRRVGAKEELLSECKKMWRLLEQVPQKKVRLNNYKYLSKLLLLETQSLPVSDDKFASLVTQVSALSAECHQWQGKRPELISKHPDTLVKVGTSQLCKTEKDFRILLAEVVEKNKKLEEHLNREQEWLEEQEQALNIANGIEEKTETQVAEHPQESIISRRNVLFYELQHEMLKLKTFKEELLHTLSEFLEDHFPLPKKDGIAENKDSSGEPAELIKLHEIVEILVNKLVDTPHEPYVTIDDSFWAPYIELLLRHGVALRHPEDPNRIRLEAFHM